MECYVIFFFSEWMCMMDGIDVCEGCAFDVDMNILFRYALHRFRCRQQALLNDYRTIPTIVCGMLNVVPLHVVHIIPFHSILLMSCIHITTKYAHVAMFIC